jgi:hypothetical protein
VGSADNNANSYQLVSVEGVDLLFMHLECNAPDEVLAWAGGVLSAHPDRRAIITTHMWLGPVGTGATHSYHEIPKGRMQWIKCHRAGRAAVTAPQADLGQARALPPERDDGAVRRPAQRRRRCGCRRSGEQDNIVHEMLSDIRDGYIRLLRFYPAQNRSR